MPNVCEVRACVWWGRGRGCGCGVTPPSVISRQTARSLLVWLIALLPIRSDPIRLDSIFFFVSFRFVSLRLHSPAPLLLLFGSILSPGGRAHAQLAARTVAQLRQQPRQTHLLHMYIYTRVHATCNSRNPAEASGMLRVKHTILPGCAPEKQLVNYK